MRLLAAFVAVQLAAWTGDRVYLHHVGLDAEVRTFLVGTVADVFVLDGVANADLLPVQLHQLRRNGVHEALEHWRFLAVRLVHAGGEDASVPQLLPDVAGPAGFAICMCTKSRCIQRGFLQADLTLPHFPVFRMPAALILHLAFPEAVPIVAEVAIGHFFLIPLIVLQNIETDILMLNIDNGANIVDLLHEFVV